MVTKRKKLLVAIISNLLLFSQISIGSELEENSDSIVTELEAQKIAKGFVAYQIEKNNSSWRSAR